MFNKTSFIVSQRHTHQKAKPRKRDSVKLFFLRTISIWASLSIWKKQQQKKIVFLFFSKLLETWVGASHVVGYNKREFEILIYQLDYQLNNKDIYVLLPKTCANTWRFVYTVQTHIGQKIIFQNFNEDSASASAY